MVAISFLFTLPELYIGKVVASSRRPIKRCLQFMDRFLKTVPAAEFLEQFNRRAHGVEGREFQDSRVVQAGDAFVLVFLQQRFEDRARLRPVARENVTLAYVVGPLTAGKWRLGEGYVADQVKWVEGLAPLLGQ